MFSVFLGIKQGLQNVIKTFGVKVIGLKLICVFYSIKLEIELNNFLEYLFEFYSWVKCLALRLSLLKIVFDKYTNHH